MTSVIWGNESFSVRVATGEHDEVAIDALSVSGREWHIEESLPIVELATASAGSFPASGRLVRTEVGSRLRYRHHEVTATSDGSRIDLELVSPGDGLTVVSSWTAVDELPAWTSRTTVRNSGKEPVVLRSVTSLNLGFGIRGSGDRLADWELLHGEADWLGEGRFATSRLRGDLFADLGDDSVHSDPRAVRGWVSTGTWSTGRYSPVGALSSASHGLSIVWQVEHNGGWRWEVGAGAYLALSGPTDTDHAWNVTLQPGESFTTIPVTVALSNTRDEGLATLTRYRRANRRRHEDNEKLHLVFNDFMNTLVGDPDESKLWPLIDAAADAGAEVFCIDAGWYADDGDWWDAVGEWQPSSRRFPHGLPATLDRIRAAGMRPGLWLEPEVIGVRSAVANRLPDAAFFQRGGQRLVEHGRYHLDLRHPATRAFLDETVDRLVLELGATYFKLDYNINPGSGTDVDSASVGSGLLDHNRAHLEWIDGIYERHPQVILENCASGAMRMDWSLLSRMQLQSTSDQERYEKYPPIAAAAPIAMLPEQAGNWAYPQPEMDDREIIFALSNAFLGRLYLSGHLNRMNAHQRELVASVVRRYKEYRPAIARSTPFWPLGIPQWDTAWTALGLDAGDDIFVAVWRRGGDRRQHLPIANGSLGRVEEWDVVVGDPGSWLIEASRAGLDLTALEQLPSAVVLRGRRRR